MIRVNRHPEELAFRVLQGRHPGLGTWGVAVAGSV